MFRAVPIMGSLVAICIGLSTSSVHSSDTSYLNYRQMPIAFTKNVGQWDEQVEFRADGGGQIAWICRDRVVYQFSRKVSRDGDSEPAFGEHRPDVFDRRNDVFEQLVIVAKFVDADRTAEIVGEGLMEYKCNYFLGNDPEKWFTDVPNYEAVTIENIYDGIDLHLFGGADGKLSYQYLFKLGSDVQKVNLEYEGAVESSINDAGRMSAQTDWGEISGLLARPPVAHFMEGGETKESDLRFSPKVEGLVYSTFLGGSNDDYGYGIALDFEDFAYVGGYTMSANFPSLHPFDWSLSGNLDIFVTKFSVSGNSLIYSTYLGGSGNDYFGDIDIPLGMPNGFACVTGFTFSYDFPMLNAYDASHNGNADVFATEFSLGGDSLRYSTYFGGAGDDYGAGISNYSVTGGTRSNNFPATSDAVDGTYNGGWDAFLWSDAFGYCTYLGGTDDERGTDIVYDSYYAPGLCMVFYISGWTKSADFPVAYAIDYTFNGVADGFVTAFDILSWDVAFSTYVGGSGEDYIESIFAGPHDCHDLMVTGETASPDFPTLNAFDSHLDGNWDAFVTKIGWDGYPPLTIVSSTYLGGSASDFGFGIRTDRLGHITDMFVTGYTTSTNFPTYRAFDDSYNGGANDVFVCRLNGSSLVYSTYLGGSGGDAGYDIVVDDSGCAYVTGETSSSDFPVQNAYDWSYNSALTGLRDAFVTKLDKEFPYICGDADGSGIISISDVVFLINYIFAGGPAPAPRMAGDVDCNGIITISDAVYLINYIFAGGPQPCAACP